MSLSHLHNCHPKARFHDANAHPFSTVKVFSFAASLGLAIFYGGLLTFSHLASAEFNVAGDEIIIYADDTVKPATRALGTAENLNHPTQANNPLLPPESYLSSEPAIAETASSEDLWQRIRNGYAIPDSTSELITKHENWYSSRPDYMKRMVERSEKYLFHIVEEVEKRGMPTEIALLPMIESAYNPQAYSRSRASGIWQFIPSTGKSFGLKQNWWVDNRRNVTAATDAALTYLQKLHGMFGAWDLALAAYNAGEGTVGRAIERNRRLGLPTDYESLELPPETRNYVPKLQAIKNLITNPTNYGLQIQTIANSAYFISVSAPAQIDSHLAANLAEISSEEFFALNPSYNRPVITKNSERHEILLPVSAAQTFKDNLAAYDRPLVSWQTYHAKRGERMDKIANKFGIEVAQLRNVNNLPAHKKLKQSSTILVPNGHQARFTVGEKVAESSVENISEINTESANVNDVADTSSQKTIQYKVQKGDRLLSIAKRHGISIEQIEATNDLENNEIQVGQILTLGVANKNIKTASKEDASRGNRKTYIVKRGDTLHTIAQKFNVGVVDIRRWNKKIHTRIRPGHRLTILNARSF
ncbi:MAG: lytic transglycosylase [Methylotenera sp.]|nr:MAG: lytic transglycosylase [Methylotenera sp.]